MTKLCIPAVDAVAQWDQMVQTGAPLISQRYHPPPSPNVKPPAQWRVFPPL